ncbi:MAG: M23 family metallopeptidase [Saprospiraceae bacterium]|nr:M23 family metallopeptidase [Saprospiraceae bacterium]
MTEDQPKKSLRDPYRLVLMKEETLEEVASYRLSLLNVYLLVSSIIVLTSILVLSVVFFTPVKRLVPGYGDIHENREYVELYKKVRTLEEEVKAQQLYAERFRALILAGADSSALDISSATDDFVGEQPNRPTISQPSPGPGSFYPAIPTVDRRTVKSNLTNGNDIDFLYLIPPLKGPVSAGYSVEDAHFGVDVLAPKNTPVKAVLDGYVITSDWTLETGNTLGIQHANNMVSFYKHNARNLKQLGSFVKAGEAVAIVGNTGEQTSGPHLHFELWVDGKPVDPQNFIAFN